MIDRLPQLGSRAAHFKQAIHDKLIDHTPYIQTYGDDVLSISGWKWGGKSGVNGARATSIEGYNI